MLLLLGWTPFNTLLIPRQSRRTGGLRVIALCRLSAPRKLVEEGARAPGPHSPVQELDFLPRVVEIHSGFHEKNWIKTIIYFGKHVRGDLAYLYHTGSMHLAASSTLLPLSFDLFYKLGKYFL